MEIIFWLTISLDIVAPDLTQELFLQLINVCLSSVFLFLTDHCYDLSSLNWSLLSPEELEDYVDLDFSFHQALLEIDFSKFM